MKLYVVLEKEWPESDEAQVCACASVYGVYTSEEKAKLALSKIDNGHCTYGEIVERALNE